MESVHRRFVVDAVDRDEWPGQYEQIDRTIAEDLVGDFQVAAFGVASAWSLRHNFRLMQVVGELRRCGDRHSANSQPILRTRRPRSKELARRVTQDKSCPSYPTRRSAP